ncbi:hypothetical protein Pcinc_011304 [Petrolisthes cinctipes]|uniref:Uncharacterized protein n=1 Tax=Petrolisthes cinctipes TaxID=88211 RepID=A0AAE1G1H8_PETCI|nr:hypothetical protein Pcinc_011304 [Petrolisthes cinctipes]
MRHSASHTPIVPHISLSLPTTLYHNTSTLPTPLRRTKAVRLFVAGGDDTAQSSLVHPGTLLSLLFHFGTHNYHHYFAATSTILTTATTSTHPASPSSFAHYTVPQPSPPSPSSITFITNYPPQSSLSSFSITFTTN